MCGIFGFAGGSPRRRPDMDRLRRIACDTERRGPHAFGFAWIDGRNRLQTYKQTGRISRHLAALDRVGDGKLLIAHCRWATRGEPEDNRNNHPHASGDGWLVHNGTIERYTELAAAYQLAPQTECDSETLALLIQTLAADRGEAIADALDLIDGPAALAGLWRNELWIARHGKPLSFGRDESGLYFASYRGELPGARELADGSVVRLRFARNRLELQPAFRLAS
jgi:glucosamine 6-phosphate synthetase-like amidotransferase/phosphosugar isomerase protein